MHSPGEIIVVTRKSFVIACGEGALRIRRLQPEGKKEMDAAAKRYPNPYENMTWDEYCEAKRREREEEPTVEPEDKKPNLGITTHFDGKVPERSPEEKEKDEHMFDDDYWVNKMSLSRDELSEIVNKAVKRIMEEINP